MILIRCIIYTQNLLLLILKLFAKKRKRNTTWMRQTELLKFWKLSESRESSYAESVYEKCSFINQIVFINTNTILLCECNYKKYDVFVTAISHISLLHLLFWIARPVLSAEKKTIHLIKIYIQIDLQKQLDIALR